MEDHGFVKWGRGRGWRRRGREGGGGSGWGRADVRSMFSGAEIAKCDGNAQLRLSVTTENLFGLFLPWYRGTVLHHRFTVFKLSFDVAAIGYAW